MNQNNINEWLEDGIRLIRNLTKITSEEFKKAQDLFERISNTYYGTKETKLFIIVNEGLHPIVPALQDQFGRQITVEVLTRGNVPMDAEKIIAQKCRTLAEKYRDYQIYIVPSGFPYLAVAAYNVLQQTLARHPIWLQYDRESGKYLKKNLDPRKLLTEDV